MTFRTRQGKGLLPECGNLRWGRHPHFVTHDCCCYRVSDFLAIAGLLDLLSAWAVALGSKAEDGQLSRLKKSEHGVAAQVSWSCRYDIVVQLELF